MDNKSRVIVGADRNLPNRNADAKTAVELVGRLKWNYHLRPRTLGADKGYATGVFVHWLLEQNVQPHVPIMDSRGRNDKGIYSIEQFQYQDDKDEFICPQGKTLRYWGIQQHSKQHAYRASPSDCRQCPVKAQCTRASYRSLSYHIYESSIEIARRHTQTRSYRISQRMRKRVEELFGEAKECMGMRRMRFRGVLFVREQVLLTATAQNIKRMVRLLSQARTENRAERASTWFAIHGGPLFVPFCFSMDLSPVKNSACVFEIPGFSTACLFLTSLRSFDFFFSFGSSRIA